MVLPPGYHEPGGNRPRTSESSHVAPDKPQSGMGHAITIGPPHALNRIPPILARSKSLCLPAPVDCVKLAVDKGAAPQSRTSASAGSTMAPTSINVICSGTMSAAVEAAIEHSLCGIFAARL